MKNTSHNSSKERGGVAVMVAIFLIVLIAAIAFAVDINHLYVVRNELQNAADAAALAGAGALYEDPDGAGIKTAGEEVNKDANNIAYSTAIANSSDKIAVDVNFTPFDPASADNNNNDIRRGHWSFTHNKFTPSDSLVAVPLWGVSTDDLDIMAGPGESWSLEAPPGSGSYPVNINAVEVVTRRNDTPAISFFAKFFGFDSFVMEARAVAYIGFAGSLGPSEADQPIVICEDTLTNNNGVYECNVGRMLDSGASCSPSDPACDPSINTAGWSDMSISDSVSECSGASSASDVKSLICAGGANQTEIQGDDYLSATNGVQTASYNDMRSCWSAATSGGQYPYHMKLPVVDCGSGTSVDNCVRVIGAVSVNMLYMSPNGGTKPKDAPTSMAYDDDPENRPVDISFNDWKYPGSCNTTVPHNLNFVGQIGSPVQDVLNNLNGFAMRNQDGEWDAPDSNDRWLANPANITDQRWHGEGGTYTEGMARWDCFVNHYRLINTNAQMASLANKSMYFMPDCSPQVPSGETAGPNFGVRAKYPVLVE